MIIGAVALAGCSKGEKTAETDSDSIPSENVDFRFTSPDLAYSELHGRVASCSLSSAGESPEGLSLTLTETSFDHEGRMTSLRTVMQGGDGEIPIDNIHFSYDADGQLIEAINEMADGPEKLEVERNEGGELSRVGVLNKNSMQAYTTYNEWGDGLCRSERYVDANGVRIVRNRFDDRDLVVSRDVIYQTEEGDLTEHYVYEYTKFDAYGNWLERKAEVTLTQNFTDAAEEDGAPSHHGPYTLAETRTITYF